MGFDLGSFLRIAELIAPAILAATGVPPVLIPVIAHGIQIAEAAGGSGSDKKAIALDAVNTAIVGINAVKPGAVDPNITKVVDEGIDATVGAINAVNKKPITVT